MKHIVNGQIKQSRAAVEMYCSLYGYVITAVHKVKKALVYDIIKMK